MALQPRAKIPSTFRYHPIHYYLCTNCTKQEIERHNQTIQKLKRMIENPREIENPIW